MSDACAGHGTMMIDEKMVGLARRMLAAGRIEGTFLAWEVVASALRLVRFTSTNIVELLHYELFSTESII